MNKQYIMFKTEEIKSQQLLDNVTEYRFELDTIIYITEGVDVRLADDVQ